MAFADPQSVTIGANTISLPRTGAGPLSGTFTSADGTVKESVSHAYNKRNRRTVRIDHSKIAPDPFVSGQNTKFTMSTYIVVDAPVTGYTVAELKDIVLGLCNYLSASTGAKVSQLLGGES